MNSQIYKKKYQLNSDNNKYIIQFESLGEEQKIRIILIYNKYNQNFSFSIEKSLNDIIMEFGFLNFSSTKSLVEYLSDLTKKDQIAIDKKFTYMNIITFFDNDKYIQFNLRRKIEQNEDRIEEIEDEIVNIYNKLEYLEDSLKNQEKITSDIKDEFQKKYENLESKLNEININNESKLNEINNNNESKFNEINHNNESKLNEINNNNNGDVKYIGKEKTIFKDSDIFNNIYYEEDIIMKDNNNNIKFNSLCYNMNKKETIFMKENNEECELFTAFNLKNNDPMIAWIIRSNKNIINIVNMKNQKKFNIKACENKIDGLQYFYNYNGDKENKEFIISFSRSDENNLTAWKINNGEDLSLEIIRKIEIKHRIHLFTIFSFTKYSNKESYIFIYEESWNRERDRKGIHLYKIDNNFNISSSSLIEEENQIQYLDTYYDMKKIKGEKLYLIDCNSYSVTLFEDPFIGNEKKIKNFKEKGVSNHLCGFIVERDNNLELFETNFEGITVWEIDDNIDHINPKLKYTLNQEFPFDIGIWNDEYFWVVTSGLKFFQIIGDKIKEKKKNNDVLRGSKIRKIIVDKNESIVGVDSNRKLSLWYK